MVSKIGMNSILESSNAWCAAHGKYKTQYCLEHKEMLCIECSSEHKEAKRCDNGKTFATCKVDALKFLTEANEIETQINRRIRNYSEKLIDVFENNESKEDVLRVYKTVKEVMDFVKRAVLYVGRKEVDSLEQAKLYHAKAKMEERILFEKLREYRKLREEFEQCQENPSQPTSKMEVCEAFEKIPTLCNLKKEFEAWLAESEAREKIKHLKNKVEAKKKKEKLAYIDKTIQKCFKELKTICETIPKIELEAKQFTEIETPSEEEKIASSTIEEEDSLISEIFNSPFSRQDQPSSTINMEDEEDGKLEIIQNHSEVLESKFIREEEKVLSVIIESQILCTDWAKRLILIGSFDKYMQKKVELPLDLPCGEYVQMSSKEFLFAGGKDKQGKEVAACFKFNIDDCSFIEVKPMKIPKSNHALVNAEGEIYSLGGAHSEPESTDLDSVEIFTEDWTEGPKLPTKAQGLAAAHLQKLYAFGGTHKGEAIRSVQVLSSGQWEEIKLSIGEEVSWSVAVPFNDSVMLLEPGKDIWLFNTSNCELEKKSDTVLSESSIDKNSAKVINGDVYVVSTHSASLLILNSGQWRKVENEEWLGNATNAHSTKITYLSG
eukprot:TRINITY_DN4007_c0_g1_i1.p1 TRINITY_DN4007_c0_g1~~TRINITY_DN4007_c0_g1_i1.p1  ORF type:complete len:606 (+),score=187.95 TRINITY_DN4007_c0_g1_i1:116-1933(+)